MVLHTTFQLAVWFFGFRSPCPELSCTFGRSRQISQHFSRHPAFSRISRDLGYCPLQELLGLLSLLWGTRCRKSGLPAKASRIVWNAVDAASGDVGDRMWVNTTLGLLVLVRARTSLFHTSEDGPPGVLAAAGGQSWMVFGRPFRKRGCCRPWLSRCRFAASRSGILLRMCRSSEPAKETLGDILCFLQCWAYI